MGKATILTLANRIIQAIVVSVCRRDRTGLVGDEAIRGEEALQGGSRSQVPDRFYAGLLRICGSRRTDECQTPIIARFWCSQI